VLIGHDDLGLVVGLGSGVDGRAAQEGLLQPRYLLDLSLEELVEGSPCEAQLAVIFFASLEKPRDIDLFILSFIVALEARGLSFEIFSHFYLDAGLSLPIEEGFGTAVLFGKGIGFVFVLFRVALSIEEGLFSELFPVVVADNHS
jgi:hypothetical protein